MKTMIIFFIFLSIINIAIAANNYGGCPYGVGVYGGDCRVVTPIPEFGGTGQVNIPPALQNSPFGTESLNGSCTQIQQMLDGRCYNCDPLTGYLEFNPNDRSVLCIRCPIGYILNASRYCLPIVKIPSYNFTINQSINSIFNNTLNQLGNKLYPKDPKFGKTIVSFGFLSILVFALNDILRDKKKKKTEDSLLFEEEKS